MHLGRWQRPRCTKLLIERRFGAKGRSQALSAPVKRHLTTAELLARKQRLPAMDADRLRADMDALIDQIIHDPYARAQQS